MKVSTRSAPRNGRGGGREGYDDETVELALTAVALSGGSASRACRRLKDEHGVTLRRGTLEHWVRATHAAQYAEIRDRRAGEVQRKVAAQFEDVAIESSEVTMEMLTRLRQEVPDIPTRELPAAVRNLANGRGDRHEQAHRGTREAAEDGR